MQKRLRMPRLLILFFASVFVFSLFFAPIISLSSYESLNSVLVIVGPKSISSLDYEEGVERYKNLSRFFPNYRKKGSLHSQVVDFLIDRAVVDNAADEESIQVNEKRIEAEIQKRMEAQGISDLEQFKKSVQTQFNLPYDVWLEDLPYQIKKGQLLQIKVSPPLPSEQEVQSWYNKNKAKVGSEFKFREIVFSPSNSSIDEETRVFNELTEIRNKSLKDPSFFKLVASGPRNESRYRLNGGLVNWVPTFELYKSQPTTASVLTQVGGAGKISEVFRDDRKRYCLVFIEGMRPTPLDAVRKGIQGFLFREKEQTSFEEWVSNTRKNSSISIFDPIYMKEYNISNPEEKYNID
ncbi:putative peptidyl-prolyl cis-trans isomerase [Leptospira meyeri]|uniref:Putative peptidyl-prolyl cis-trans isomerase n=1 Tax=Leptospira meyeri TaxID=29508 RepID=A0A4R8MUJ6_LEPME|nr:putative peptidyl-prolyl cis-trans isomerase [Leptospira meyeri]EKJ87454.1 peptidyl-prolyl cis-trans isomerase, TIGR04142 family [Leptospira meyeri serovar Hardjo str. Went 5]MCW7488585.1 putative peptidyl-prolyl cis-trans isomerase [Leptospira meyeri]PJZ81250.1 putative peptidyl-prolyl cis-trans isomerase [Leptospira meyeri]PJZ96755.1 putative peptidyl-prolyl cis-trans isomerase [Leptospira meyeri]PKA12226.1 putative peptidyl-prolyl cis-trans isomerase [Leptospira meyeri]